MGLTNLTADLMMALNYWPFLDVLWGLGYFVSIVIATKGN